MYIKFNNNFLIYLKFNKMFVQKFVLLMNDDRESSCNREKNFRKVLLLILLQLNQKASKISLLH